MSALKPGFYRATVEGVPNIPLMVTDELWIGWTTRKVPDTHYGTYGHEVKDITDARPLILLDLGYPLETASLLRRDNFTQIADQIEAQCKPARISEPGLWGVVEASVPFNGRRTHYLHDDTKPGAGVWTSHSGRVAWDSLIDPTLVREGVTS